MDLTRGCRIGIGLTTAACAVAMAGIGAGSAVAAEEDAYYVASTVLRLFAGTESGECWFVQPGREPAAFGFRNLPGPR